MLGHSDRLHLRRLDHFGDEAYLRSSFGKLQYVTILEIGLRDLPAIQVGAVGAVIDQLELVPFTDDVGVFSRDTGEF